MSVTFNIADGMAKSKMEVYWSTVRLVLCGWLFLVGITIFLTLRLPIGLPGKAVMFLFLFTMITLCMGYPFYHTIMHFRIRNWWRLFVRDIISVNNSDTDTMEWLMDNPDRFYKISQFADVSSFLVRTKKELIQVKLMRL